MASRRERPYTKRGDDGTTGLLFGTRVEKDELAPEAYGAVDEACAALGMARATADDELAGVIKRLQTELFVVGAELATSPENHAKLVPGKTSVTSEMVTAIEERIDALVERIELPQEFVLPGQNPCAAALDLARAIVRRAERVTVSLKRAGRLPNDEVLRYLNRLSDLIYMLARLQEGEEYERLAIF